MELINRDGVLKWIINEGHIKAMGGNNWIRVEEVVSKLNSMIAYLMPMPGKWKVYETDEDDRPLAWQCDNCDEVVSVKHNYCPKCGREMMEGTHE